MEKIDLIAVLWTGNMIQLQNLYTALIYSLLIAITSLLFDLNRPYKRTEVFLP